MKDSKEQAIIVKIVRPHAWYTNKVGQQARVVPVGNKYVIEGNFFRGDHQTYIRMQDAEEA